ncbi:hypothetical protein WICPIJ_003511 [Wickerhamomyces pijperi]|uniref:FAD-binding FR-type domain-containing protein n=1 Tax=Wickerhamomyces pijperi TaxID=599730 RepID=A0A9P8Q702_WICPI|nr:hypothetical protein WICPIJ_003511 [Wickerhamomyces pijperi]
MKLINFIQFWISTLLLSSLVSCEQKGKVAFYACYQYVSQFSFKYKASKSIMYDTILNYPPATGTFLNCFAGRFGAYSGAFNQSVDRTIFMASSSSHMNLTDEFFYKQYANATKFSIDRDPKLNLTKTVFTSPIKVPYADSKLKFDYFLGFYWNMEYSNNMVGYMNVLFGFVLLFIGLGNFIKRLGYHRSFNNKFINWYRANVTIPATFNGKHTEDLVLWKKFTTLVPTRVESIVVGLFIIMNIVCVSIHYNTPTLNASTSMLSWNLRHLADRTGVFSFGLIPLLILFAGRNNILTSLTGLPYTSFIVFHKWVSRFMWIHAFLHSVAWTANVIAGNSWSKYLAYAYWRWGIVATTVGALMLFQALRVFRNLSYEIFLTLHIVFGVLFLVGCFYHCYTLGWMEWIYASCALWFADRVLRLVRMSLFGFPQAEIVMISNDTFKVTVENGRWFKPFPGAFAYLYFITPALFLQSHPFTVFQSIKNKNQTLIFIKTKTGVTKRIKEKIDTTSDGKLKLRVCLEGPYGHRAPLHQYDTAMILAGGNGIPGPLAYALDLGMRDSAQRQHIKFVWTIRSLEYLHWFKDEFDALSKTPVDIQVYVTGGLPCAEKSIKFKSDSNKSDQNSESNCSLNSDLQLMSEMSSFVQFYSGRPNIDQMILKEFTTENRGSVGIVTCGAPVMVDNIRTSVANHLQKCPNRVDLFEELQVW